jgi:hypothetical protein
MPDGRVFDPETGHVLYPGDPRAKAVIAAAAQVAEGKLPVRTMPRLATLPHKVFTGAEAKMREYARTASIPLHSASVLFPKDLDEYRKAVRTAYGLAEIGEPFGGYTGFAGNSHQIFVAGRPEKMSWAGWTRYRTFYQNDTANELFDKFYDWERLCAGWHECFHAFGLSEHFKAFRDKQYVESLFKSQTDADSDQNANFRGALEECFADAAATLALLDDQSLPEGDKQRFLNLQEWNRSAHIVPNNWDHDSASTAWILRQRYEQGVARYEQAVQEGTIEPGHPEEGMIVPGQMTPGDMAKMAMEVMRERLPELRREFATDEFMAENPGGVGLIDPSFLEAQIAGVRQRAGSRTDNCAWLAQIDKGLSRFPQKQKEIINATRALHLETPAEVPDGDSAKVRRAAQEAEMALCKRPPDT